MDWTTLLYAWGFILAVWLAHRRGQKADTLRIEHLAAANLRVCARNEELNTENAELRAAIDRMVDVARMLEAANYQLGCMVFGKEHVDRQLAQLKKNVRN
jgi:hypothetical protein